MDFKSFFNKQKPTGPYKQKKYEDLVPVANIFKNSTDFVVSQIENFISSPSKTLYDIFYFLFDPYTVSYDKKQNSWGIGFSAKVDSFLSKSLPNTIEEARKRFITDYENDNLPHPKSFYENKNDLKLVFYYNKNFYVTRLKDNNSNNYQLIKKKNFRDLSNLLQTYEDLFDILKNTSKVEAFFRGPVYYIKRKEEDIEDRDKGPLASYFSDVSKNWDQIKHNLKMMRKGL